MSGYLLITKADSILPAGQETSLSAISTTQHDGRHAKQAPGDILLEVKPPIGPNETGVHKNCICLDEMIQLLEMKSELTEARLQQIEEAHAKWTAIIQEWDNLGPYDTIPSFTKKHAEKMIQRLCDEVDQGIDNG